MRVVTKFMYRERTCFPRKGRSPLPRKMRAVATRWGGLVAVAALAGVGDGLFHTGVIEEAEQMRGLNPLEKCPVGSVYVTWEAAIWLPTTGCFQN